MGSSGGIFRTKSRAPILGGSFAVWGMCFASFDCSFAAIRMKEDPWNGIMSGFCTGGLLSIRAGPKVAMRSAVAGGVILAIFEGIGIALNKYLSPSSVTPDEQLLSMGADGAGVDRSEFMKVLNNPKDPTTPPPPDGYVLLVKQENIIPLPWRHFLLHPSMQMMEWIEFLV